MTEDKMIDSITDRMYMSLNMLWEMLKGREAWCAAVHWVTKKLDMTEQLCSNSTGT